jgi:hypothetical protein
MLYWTIKRGHGKHFIETLNKNPLPFFTSYFVAAFFAEEHGYKGDIYCLCTDTDISRAWAPLNGEKSRIIYCAPDERVKERLKLYGVSPDKIVLTGFPIPKEILGDKDKLDAIKSSLARRLSKVDPNGKYTTKRSELIKDQLGAEYPLIADAKPLTVTFAVGGAGAQYKIGIAVLKSLAEQIRDGKIKLNLIAGTSMRIFKKYRNALKKSSLVKNDEKGVEIIYDHDMAGYMHKFNKVIIETDVLWTKPSELSFYAGAGLPIIIAPPLGAQEESNQEWLHINGAGIDQPNPKYANEWLHDTLEQGTLAEIAMNAYINISKHGVYHIEKLIFQKEK